MGSPNEYVRPQFTGLQSAFAPDRERRPRRKRASRKPGSGGRARRPPFGRATRPAGRRWGGGYRQTKRRSGPFPARASPPGSPKGRRGEFRRAWGGGGGGEGEGVFFVGMAA